jgi:hypothetical protein
MQYAFASSAIGLLLVIYVPFLQDVFETVALTGGEWLIVLPLLVLTTIVAELTKPFLQRMTARQASAAQ